MGIKPVTLHPIAWQPALPHVPGKPLRRGSTWLMPVPHQPGLYASSHGHIWSTRGRRWRKLRTRRGGFKERDSRGGYLVLHFRDHVAPRPRPRKAVSVHILVCTAWHGPKPGPAYEVDHIDHDHLNNRPDNLRWITAAENNARRRSGGMDSDEDWADML